MTTQEFKIKLIGLDGEGEYFETTDDRKFRVELPKTTKTELPKTNSYEQRYWDGRCVVETWMLNGRTVTRRREYKYHNPKHYGSHRTYQTRTAEFPVADFITKELTA